ESFNLACATFSMNANRCLNRNAGFPAIPTRPTGAFAMMDRSCYSIGIDLHAQRPLSIWRSSWAGWAIDNNSQRLRGHTYGNEKNLAILTRKRLTHWGTVSPLRKCG